MLCAMIAANDRYSGNDRYGGIKSPDRFFHYSGRCQCFRRRISPNCSSLLHKKFNGQESLRKKLNWIGNFNQTLNLLLLQALNVINSWKSYCYLNNKNHPTVFSHSTTTFHSSMLVRDNNLSNQFHSILPQSSATRQ